MITTVTTSMRDDEVDQLDRRAAQAQTSRAGVTRALIRFGLEHWHEFARELEDEAASHPRPHEPNNN